ncbi:MAG TPA: aldose 1-epimerase family protein [Puia sp.]|nr:aldose 1-epimerase family protein [Puia sp.]
MFTIENNLLKVSINAKGAELQSIFHKTHQLEYMWSGDPAFWAKKSPILFPIVGTLKNDEYFYNNRYYKLGRHGFARDMEFEPKNQTANSISFLLISNETTLQHFPFQFELIIKYSIEKDNLTVMYILKNISEGDMYFSIGAHPAFKVPLVDGTEYADHYLQFNKDETLPRWPISPDGLIEKTPEPFLQDQNVLPLRKELFYKDALVFKHPVSSTVSLLSNKTDHGLHFNFSGFPYLGIWAAKNADFVCIEPWCGIADSVDSDQQITNKEGIIKLNAGEIFERKWIASFY